MSLLSQDADPYLILRQGESYTGFVIAEVDDSWHWGSWLSAFDAQIIRNGLPAGTYTIEAATDRNGLRGDAGAFSLAASIRSPLEAPDAPTNMMASASTTEFDKITASWSLPPAPAHKPRTAVVVQWTSTGQASSKLVSNTGQPDDGVGGDSPQAAQGFRTGSNTAGYKLTSVDISYDVMASNPNLNAAIWTANSSGEPDSQLAPLTAPASPAVGLNTFTAAGGGVNLDPDTLYFVFVGGHGNSGRQSWYDYIDEAGIDDSGAAAGWSIENESYLHDPWSLQTGSSALIIKLAINGYANRSTPGDSEGTAVLGGGATSHTISGLDHHTGYTVTVKARNSEGDSSTDTATATTMNISPPDAPTGLTATTDANNPGEIAVTWTNGSTTATTPRTAVVVEWNTTADPTNTLDSAVISADATSYTITGLAHSTGYSVSVRSRNPAGDSARARQAADVVTPASPLAVWFAADTPQIRISSNNVRIFLQTSSSKSASVTCSAWSGQSINCPPGTLVSIGGFTSATSFIAHLVEVSGGVLSRIKYENELVMRHTHGEWTFYSDVGGPEAPEIAVSAGNQKVTVGWSAPTQGSNGEFGKPGNVLSGYQVWHRAQNSDGSWPGWTKSTWLDADTREHEITGLTNGTNVQVRVRARAESNDHNGVLTQYEGITTGSCPANTRVMCNVTPTSGAGSPSTPRNFSASAGSNAGELNVFWGAPATPAGGVHLYRVEYKLTTESTWTAVLVSGLTTSTTITGLTSGSAYHVRVRAEGAAGDSTYTTQRHRHPHLTPTTRRPRSGGLRHPHLTPTLTQ